MTITITNREKMPELDIIRFTAIVEDEGSQRTITADAWLSAVTNHYPEAAYKQDGGLRAAAKPRRMTREEFDQFALNTVLRALNAAPVAPVWSPFEL